MSLTPKEIKENVDNLEIDPHFERRLKKRNLKLDEVKDYLKNKIPIIIEINEFKYKISYRLEKERYLTLYLLKVPKGLKMLTVFIEKRIKKV